MKKVFKTISLPLLLCSVLLAANTAKGQQMMMAPQRPVQMQLLPQQQVQITPVFINVNSPVNHTPPHKMGYVNAPVPFQTVTYADANDANPNNVNATPQVSDKALAMRSVAAGAGIVGLLAGGRLNTKFTIGPKLKIFGGVGWGSKVCNVGIIF